MHAQLWPILCDATDRSPPGSSEIEFFTQEYWSGLPFLTPGDRPNLRIEPESSALAGGFLTTAPPGCATICNKKCAFWSLSPSSGQSA